MELDVKINLDDWSGYEETIAETIRDAILSEVRIEAKKQAKQVRAAVAKKLHQKNEKLIALALDAVDKM